jgi:predicted PurR-regulated permease PerM
MTPEIVARRYRAILVIAAVALLAVLLWLARDALTPFIVGAVLAYLLLPVVRLIERGLPIRGRWAGLRRPLAIVLLYVAAVSLIYLVIRLVAPPLIGQIADIAQAAPELAAQARERADAWLAQYHAAVPDEVEAVIDPNLSQIATALVNAVRTALTSSAGWLLRTVNLIIGLLIIPIWLFYVLKDQERGSTRFYSLFPPAIATDVRAVVGITDNVLKRYIRGQLVLGLTIGVASFVFLTLAGIPYSLLLAILNGFFELIPIIGPWLGAIPAVIVTLAVAPEKVVLVIIFYVVLQQIENVFLVPKIQGDAVDINPAILIIALAIGGSVGGVWGLLAAVPLTAIARDVFIYLYRRFSPAVAAPPAVAVAGAEEPPAALTTGPAAERARREPPVV